MKLIQHHVLNFSFGTDVMCKLKRVQLKCLWVKVCVCVCVYEC